MVLNLFSIDSAIGLAARLKLANKPIFFPERL
jgi:hypothetical protein